MRRAKRTLLVGAVALAVGACSGDDETPTGAGASGPGASGSGSRAAESGDPGGASTAGAGDASNGEEIYGNVCATCHGGNPSQAGTVGPAIAGSSRELVEAKVLRGEYPAGYTPKRGGKAMPPLPYLKDYVADIAAFLDAAQER